jgi:hypothetical protein
VSFVRRRWASWSRAQRIGWLVVAGVVAIMVIGALGSLGSGGEEAAKDARTVTEDEAAEDKGTVTETELLPRPPTRLRRPSQSRSRVPRSQSGHSK